MANHGGEVVMADLIRVVRCWCVADEGPYSVFRRASRVGPGVLGMLVGVMGGDGEDRRGGDRQVCDAAEEGGTCFNEFELIWMHLLRLRCC